MNVLLIGGGASTHALAWKLLDDSRVYRVYCAPGNGATSLMAHNVPYRPDRPKDLALWAWEQGIEMTLVVDDVALADGVIEAFRTMGLDILAPEGKLVDACASRSLARALFARRAVPTLPGHTASDLVTLEHLIADKPWPLRLRPDNAYTSNWTAVAHDATAARQAAQSILSDLAGTPGVTPSILVEEAVPGIELGASAFVMGADVGPVALSFTQHHLDDGALGPYTDGLGAYSPPRVGLPDDLAARIRVEGIEPLAKTLDYRGILHLDVLLTPEGKWLTLGLRATLGDPEAQVVLPRLDGSLLDALRGVPGPWRAEATCGVVLSAEGYPSINETYAPITGLDTLDPGVLVFQGGTSLPRRGPDFSLGFSPLVA
ncbi:MAG: hypothetical protein KJ734_09150, partial [Chloroflexi bacterium]|nr:hypothetical protein [Chloroflexota bacterium]